ncbi:MAG: class I SAM-dependent methyltransferase [Chloroflexota bacterium]
MHDPYAGFAGRYDLFFGAFDEHDPRKVEFFRQLFERHDVKKVLDCACGTGRDLDLFSKLGVDVLGSDVSPSMLAQAERNLASHGLQVPLAEVDYRELPFTFATRFDAVVCLASAHFEMPDEHELTRAFTSMRDVLRPGGVLVVSSGMSDKTWNEKPRFIPEVNRDDFTRLFIIDYLERGTRFNVLDLTHRGEENVMNVWSITYKKVFLHDDMETSLKRAGFSSYTFYGSHLFEPYSKEASQMLIAVAVN